MVAARAAEEATVVAVRQVVAMLKEEWANVDECAKTRGGEDGGGGSGGDTHRGDHGRGGSG
jgi:hypothetical protein